MRAKKGIIGKKHKPQYNGMVSVKVYWDGKNMIVVGCDSELIGKKFVEDELCLKIGSFYDGKKVNEKIFLEHLASATSANLVGESAVNAAVKSGYISKENVIRIQGIPYAMMVRII